MGNFAYRQVLKGLNINGLGPTARAGPKSPTAHPGPHHGAHWTEEAPRRRPGKEPHGAVLAKSPTAQAGPYGAGGTERRKKPHFHALQASDASFLVDEEIVTGAQEFVFV